MSLARLAAPVVHRFFFALKPDAVTAHQTHAFAEAELGSRGLLEPERLHITLAITPDMPVVAGDLLEALRRTGEAARADPFDVSLDRLSGGGRTIALRPGRVIQPLQALQTSIAAAMAKEGLAMRESWRFSPHMTLCYRKGMTPMGRAVTGFRWQAHDFVLIHSFIGWHRHDILGRWPLGGVEEDAQPRLL
jgi:2'-5' RNA ligase